MRRPIPSVSYLNECVDYTPETGALIWRVRPRRHFRSERVWKIWNTRFAGTPAFNIDAGNGYRVGCLDSTVYMAHRIAWVIYNGEIDEREVDHINGARDDNRMQNLRLVTPTENRRNAAIPRHNTSGFVGVGFRQSKGRWCAYITVDNRSRHLGYFSSKEDAVQARQEAERAIGFHPNHGRASCG